MQGPLINWTAIVAQMMFWKLALVFCLIVAVGVLPSGAFIAMDTEDMMREPTTAGYRVLLLVGKFSSRSTSRRGPGPGRR